MRIRDYIPLLISMLLVSACGGGEPQNTPQPTAVPATATPPAASQQPTATPAQQPAATPTADAGSGQAATRQLNLDATPTNLKSYRIRFTLSFDGKLPDGNALKGTAEFIQEAIAETNEQRIRFSSSRRDDQQATEKKTTVDRFVVDGVNYYYASENDGEGQCISVSASEPGTPQAAIFKLGDLIGNPQSRLVEQGVAINGIRTNRYVVETPGVKGEAWVAQEGDFVVKYVGESTGKTVLFEGADGRATWEYQLEAINAISRIELPEACLAQKPSDDIPVPASAADKAQYGGLISFKASEPPQKIAEFYKAEMPRLGWTQGEATESGDLFLMDFSKDGRMVSITINKEGTGSGVLITEKK